MFCFRDMSFCDASCATAACPRNWGKLDKTEYNKWSEAFDEDGGPVCFGNFAVDCGLYVPETVEDKK